MSSLEDTKYLVCLHSKKTTILIKEEKENRIILDSCPECVPLFKSVGFREQME